MLSYLYGHFISVLFTCYYFQDEFFQRKRTDCVNMYNLCKLNKDTRELTRFLIMKYLFLLHLNHLSTGVNFLSAYISLSLCCLTLACSHSHNRIIRLHTSRRVHILFRCLGVLSPSILPTCTM